MKIIVCDASPLIFLAKLDLLSLIEDILGGKVYVLHCVVEEIRSDKATAAETRRLDAFLDEAEIIHFEITETKASALSRSDQSTLRWAIDHQADWLIADEKLLRRIALEEGIPVTGFLGLLVEAAKTGRLTGFAAREAVQLAVKRHGCRISAALYHHILAALDEV